MNVVSIRITESYSFIFSHLIQQLCSSLIYSLVKPLLSNKTVQISNQKKQNEQQQYIPKRS